MLLVFALIVPNLVKFYSVVFDCPRGCVTLRCKTITPFCATERTSVFSEICGITVNLAQHPTRLRRYDATIDMRVWLAVTLSDGSVHNVDCCRLATPTASGGVATVLESDERGPSGGH